jgi:hypothetical protein
MSVEYPQMTTSMSPEDIRAAAETYRELGPGYQDAVIESFLDKVSGEIDARVDSRLLRQQSQAQPTGRARRGGSGSPLLLAVVSLVLGIPISAVAAAAGSHPAGALGLIVAWGAITVINIAYNSGRARSGRLPGQD